MVFFPVQHMPNLDEFEINIMHKHVNPVLNVLDNLADIDERTIEHRSTICNVQHRLTNFER